MIGENGDGVGDHSKMSDLLSEGDWKSKRERVLLQVSKQVKSELLSDG